jgi:carbon-monoxide dehydrogenase medium subunit
MDDFVTASSLEELFSFLRKNARENGKPVRFVAGGTDWAIKRRADAYKSIDSVSVCFDLSGIGELKGIARLPNDILVGAMETMTSVAENEDLRRHAACLAEAAASVGSWQIRNRATLGGNLANASPAADTPVALSALDAVALLASPRGRRELPVSQVPTGPNSNVLEADELIAAFRIPLERERVSAFGKVGSRSQVSIARLNLAVSVSQGKARVFAGTLGTAVRRCPQAEKSIAAPYAGAESFCEALAAEVREAIPGRSTLLYKQSAARALGLDLWAALSREGR